MSSVAAGLLDIFNVATPFVDRHVAEGRGDKVAIECGDQRVTFRQLIEHVNRADQHTLEGGRLPVRLQ